MIGNHRCIVLKNINVAKGMYKITLDAPVIAQTAKPGQFVNISIPKDRSLLLRRPISIYYADAADGRLELVYQVVGMGTEIISNLNPGDSLDIIGPLGKGFHMDNAKKVFLIGGGCGVAPLRFIPETWPDREYHIFLGYRSVDLAYDLHIFDDYSSTFHLASEDGSLGIKGFITQDVDESLKKNKPDLIMACGPVPMMKAVKRLSIEYDIPCQISLEERMGCGTGGCLVCSCRIGSTNDWSYKRVCADGPVFWSGEVLFDE